MQSKTYFVCKKCNSINKVDIEKIKLMQPICGTCGSPISMHSLVSETNFNGLNKIRNKIDQPIVVDFWAPWCGPCLSFAPTFEKASLHFGGKAVFVKINTQENPEASEKFNIQGIPTFIVFLNKKEVGRQSGAFPLQQFTNWVQQFTSPTMQKGMDY